MLVQALVELVGPERALQIFGVKLVGITAETGRKILLSVLAVLAIALLGRGLEALIRPALRGEKHLHARFWWRQAIRLATAGIALLLLLSIWFDDPRPADHRGGSRNRRAGVRPAEGGHRIRRVLRHPARQDVQRRRPDHDGRRARRRHRPGVHPDDHHGDGPAAAGAERRARRCGSRAGSTPGASSPSPTTRSSTSRSTTTPAISPTSGRRCELPVPYTADRGRGRADPPGSRRGGTHGRGRRDGRRGAARR